MAFQLNSFYGRFDVVRNRPLWGSFYDTTVQTAAANTPQPITINSTDANSNGVSIASNSRITFARTGVFTIIYSIQFTNADEQIHDVNVWLRKNNQGNAGNLADTDSRFSIPSSHGGISGHLVATVNYMLKLAANDYLELVWATPDADVKIETIPASAVAPVHPRIPGIIVTAAQVA